MGYVFFFLDSLNGDSSKQMSFTSICGGSLKQATTSHVRFMHIKLYCNPALETIAIRIATGTMCINSMHVSSHGYAISPKQTPPNPVEQSLVSHGLFLAHELHVSGDVVQGAGQIPTEPECTMASRDLLRGSATKAQPMSAPYFGLGAELDLRRYSVDGLAAPWFLR